MCFRLSQDNSTKVNAEMGQNRSLYIEPELGLLILVITNVTSSKAHIRPIGLQCTVLYSVVPVLNMRD